MRNEFRAIEKYYSGALKRFGDTYQAVGWYSEYTQRLRFAVLSTVGELRDASVLDVGCGTGEFFREIWGTDRRDVSQGRLYKGIDISPAMIERAREKFPQCRFICADFFEYPFSEKFDFVVSSGVFNNLVAEPMGNLRMAMEKMFGLAKKGMTFNLLSVSANEKEKDRASFFYFDPVEVLKLALELTPFVEIKQHYLPNDFTVFLYRR